MAKKQSMEILTLRQWMIRELDTPAYRAGKAKGMKHPKKEKIRDAVGGLQSLLVQTKEMEADPVLKQWFFPDYRAVGTDINKIEFHVDIMGELCCREGIEDPRQRQLRYLSLVRTWKAEADTEWIDPFYDHIIERLEAGEEIKKVNLEDPAYFACLNALVSNREPVWERIFSTAVFYKKSEHYDEDSTPSKTFRKHYREKMLRILRVYSPYYVEGMTDEELLTEHGVWSYTQTLEWKGPMTYQIENEALVDTSGMLYGHVMNAQTMEHASPMELKKVRRIMTIENKANYESIPYQEDTLYIYCHGFFSPKERRFLEKLVKTAAEDVEYLHWGDMDFGGIRIFLFNQKELFPTLCPHRMGRAEFEQAASLGAAIALSAEKRLELEKLDAGALSELKTWILENDCEIEQEMLLTAVYKNYRG